MRDDALADAEHLGLSPEQVGNLRASIADDFDGVWPENIEAVLAFLTVSTQWRTAPAGNGYAYTGLDYGAVKVALDAAEIEVTPELWSRLQTIEAEARAAANKVFLA